jgi:hypothetical protein
MSRLIKHSFAPFAASFKAIALPMPRLPPVITATFPVKVPSMATFLHPSQKTSLMQRICRHRDPEEVHP